MNSSQREIYYRLIFGRSDCFNVFREYARKNQVDWYEG